MVENNQGLLKIKHQSISLSFALICFLTLLTSAKSANAQKVLDYWYSESQIGSVFAGMLLVDTTEKASVILNHHFDVTVTTADGRTVSSNEEGKLKSAIISPDINPSAERMPFYLLTATHDGYHYFVTSNLEYPSDTFEFFGETLVFNGHGIDYSIQIIKTDFQFKVIDARRLNIEGLKNSIDLYSVLFDKNDKLNIFVKHDDTTGSETKNGEVTIKTDAISTVHPLTGDEGWFDLITIDQNLRAENVLSFEDTESDTDFRFGHNGGFGSPGWGVSTFRDFVLFNFGHVLEILSENTLRISQINKEYDIYAIDTFESNLLVANLESFSNRSILTMSYGAEQDSLYIQDTGWIQPTLAKDGLVLCEIDKRNKIKVHHNFRGFNRYMNPTVNFQDGIIWLKMMIIDTVFLNRNTIIPQGRNQVMYFAFDTLFNLIGQFEGFHSHFRYIHASTGPPIIQDNIIYDLNRFGHDFCVGEYCKQIHNDSDYIHQEILYTKIATSTPPIFRPDFSYDSLSCSKIKLVYKKTDAQHYTILVSNDAITTFPKNGKNYNYSPDFLKSTKLSQHTRVLYQGPDTSVIITNLVAGRKYYFTVVPGNGTPHFTNYNTDSIDTLSLYIPQSVWQDSLQIIPSIDTGICQFDTLRFMAKSSLDIRWMDQNQQKERLLEHSANYHYLVTDTLGCLASSDTFAYIIYPNPERTSLKIATDKPWCQGDTVQLRASSEHTLLWSTKETADDIKVTTSDWYGVTATSDMNCTTTDSLEVRFIKAPIFQFSGDSLVLYADETELLPDFKTNADSFQWTYSDDTSDSYTGFPPINKAFLKVYALHQSGCYALDSLLTLVLPVQLNVLPNAFTPNNDGLNDVWKFYPSDSTGTLTIFDRWGEILIRDRTQQWDGVKQGQVLPEGVYFLMYEYEEGTEKKRLETPVFLMR